MKHLNYGLLFALVFNCLIWFAFLYAAWPTQQDFTDSGVGCINNCLEIQDEADTVTSKERN
mgnify:CR=1 FL=1